MVEPRAPCGGYEAKWFQPQSDMVNIVFSNITAETQRMGSRLIGRYKPLSLGPACDMDEDHCKQSDPGIYWEITYLVIYRRRLNRNWWSNSWVLDLPTAKLMLTNLGPANRWKIWHFVVLIWLSSRLSRALLSSLYLGVDRYSHSSSNALFAKSSYFSIWYDQSIRLPSYPTIIIDRLTDYDLNADKADIAPKKNSKFDIVLPKWL